MRTIDAVKSNFKDFARPNLFTIQVTKGAGVISNNDILETAVTEASFPSYQIGDLLLQWRGYRIPIPGDMIFGDVRLSFMNDTQFKSRNFFLRWMNEIRDPRINTISELSELKNGILKIIQLDNMLKPCYIVKCFNCYPNHLEDILLASESENQVELSSVTMVFTHFEVEIPNNA